MARPRKFASDAERQAAHRARQAAETVRVSRQALEALVQSVEAAAAEGCPVAQTVRTGTPEGLLRNLAHWFRERSAAGGE